MANWYGRREDESKRILEKRKKETEIENGKVNKS
jgi:hypothetical protein